MYTRIFALAALVTLAATAAAQSATPHTLAPDGHPVTISANYRLTNDAMLQRGCFGDCRCPVQLGTNFLGSLRLTSLPPGDPASRRFAVDQLVWSVGLSGAEQFITGSGTYEVRIADGLQRLDLELQVGDEPLEQFTSGWVTGGGKGDFPPINIAVSINDLQCFDTLIEIAADPIDEAAPQAYDLTAESFYTIGCLPPCRCPIAISELSGDFALIPLRFTPLRIDMAMLNMDWRRSAGPLPPFQEVTGAGIYTVRFGPLGIEFHQLRALITSDGVTERFDSGLVDRPAGDEFRIDIARNEFQCFDEVYEIVAEPRPDRPTDPTTPQMR